MPNLAGAADAAKRTQLEGDQINLEHHKLHATLAMEAEKLAMQKRIADMKLMADQEDNERSSKLNAARLAVQQERNNIMAAQGAQRLADAWEIAQQKYTLDALRVGQADRRLDQADRKISQRDREIMQTDEYNAWRRHVAFEKLSQDDRKILLDAERIRNDAAAKNRPLACHPARDGGRRLPCSPSAGWPPLGPPCSCGHPSLI